MVLWSIGVYDLGLASNEFWTLTPAQFFVLLDRRKQDLYRLDARSGIIAATIANVHRGKSSKEFKPQDFMPQSIVKAIEDGFEMTPSEMMAKFMGLTGARRRGKQGDRNRIN